MEKFINIPEIVVDLCIILKAKKCEAFVVGGYVRDQLLGIDSQDIDIATDMHVDDIVEVMKQYSIVKDAKKTGDKFPVARIFTDCGHEFEIATFRTESGNGKDTIFETCSTIEEDVKRRDFTINALFADGVTGEVFDVVGGLRDLEDKILRFVGDAEMRILEDRTRILRLARFINRFEFFFIDDITISDFTLREGLKDSDKVKREMMIEEFKKGIKQCNAVHYISTLSDFGVLDEMFFNSNIVRPVTDLKDVVGILSILLIDLDHKELEIVLKDGRWDNDTINKVSVINRLFKLFEEDEIDLPDLPRFIDKIKRCNFTDIDFLKLLFGEKRIEFINKFLSFELTVKAESFPDLKGKELGIMILKTENELLRRHLR